VFDLINERELPLTSSRDVAIMHKKKQADERNVVEPSLQREVPRIALMDLEVFITPNCRDRSSGYSGIG
jgi:hypothetical protein